MSLNSPVEVTDTDVTALLAELTKAVRTMQAVIYGRPPSSCPYCGGTAVSAHAAELRTIFDQLSAWGLSVDHSIFDEVTQ